MKAIACAVLCCAGVFIAGCAFRGSESKVASAEQAGGRSCPVRPQRPSGLAHIEFPDAEPTHTMQVLGNVPGVDYSTWQRTGLSLCAGDTLYIQAEGKVQYVGKSTMGPDGRGNTFRPALLPDVSFMSLVGRLPMRLLDDGLDPSGRGLYGPGFVGSAFKMEYDGDHGDAGNRRLHLAINDSLDIDNDYAFTVRIWIVNDGQVLPFEARETARLLEQ